MRRDFAPLQLIVSTYSRRLANTAQIAAMTAMILLWPRAASADPLSTLGSYERQSVQEVLDLRRLHLDEAPEGKRIHTISIANLEVFGPNTGWWQHFNVLHRTTRESAIRREVLVHAGDRWLESTIRETERILRNPSLSSFVVVVPVQSQIDDSVDLLVVTRDVWSLRTNSEFVHQDGDFTFVKLAAAENNILGRRKHLSLIFEMDQGDYSLSTRWRDLNVLGKRWQLVFRPRLIFGRANNDFEGTESLTRLEYPLWSLATRWGFATEATHRDAIARTFDGADLATYDDPSSAEIESIPQEYGQKDFAIRSQVSRSLGETFKHNFSVGHELLVTRSRVLDSAQIPPTLAENFAFDLFPRQERSSALTLGYQFFEARYVTYRNLNGYDLPEVRLIGASLRAEIALGLRPFGSERTFGRHALRVGYALDLAGEALMDAGLTLARRFEKGVNGELDSVDATYGADWIMASPVLGGHRLVTFGEAKIRDDVRDNQLIRLGGQDDLRGYKIGSFTGTSFYRASIELRSQPRKLSFLRVGYIAFYDAGGAANRPMRLGLHQDFGLGLKALIPQTGESLMFFNWAVPVDRGARQFPGRLSLGFEKEI